jgi:hypothetical protein
MKHQFTHLFIYLLNLCILRNYLGFMLCELKGVKQCRMQKVVAS